MPLVMCQEMFKTPDIFILAWKLEEFGVNGFDAENLCNSWERKSKLLYGYFSTSIVLSIIQQGADFVFDLPHFPAFHSCVGANEEQLTPKWYKENDRTLLTAAEETISYKILIVATGARALKLEEFGVNGPDAMSLSFLCFFASQIVDEDDKNATAEFWHFIRFDLPFKIMVSQVTFGTDGLVMASVSSAYVVV
ncbi:putative monodehydroascorbate reductase [Cucumis melo var. makuwa]|uniref:Putative monodehydroascorbate reductase n=1 Tax=Cucumis melo var. makuwa TaxID=1194695 RepID=A0A5D3D564_CUCMM|nr:putative monodehydroascorbate reductase [Cucumis melo var. makuwa]